jgi:hypothetical protein
MNPARFRRWSKNTLAAALPFAFAGLVTAALLLVFSDEADAAKAFIVGIAGGCFLALASIMFDILADYPGWRDES